MVYVESSKFSHKLRIHSRDSFIACMHPVGNTLNPDASLLQLTLLMIPSNWLNVQPSSPWLESPKSELTRLWGWLAALDHRRGCRVRPSSEAPGWRLGAVTHPNPGPEQRGRPAPASTRPIVHRTLVMSSGEHWPWCRVQTECWVTVWNINEFTYRS